jgi:hypothetical protein
MGDTMKKLVLFITILTIALVGCSEPTCYEQAEEVGFLEAIDDIIERWDDANIIAASTSRISLNGPVSELQAIVREARDLETPDCAVDVRDSLVEVMADKVDIYIKFMGDADADISSDIAMNETKFETFLNYYATLLDSKPPE